MSVKGLPGEPANLQETLDALKTIVEGCERLNKLYETWDSGPIVFPGCTWKGSRELWTIEGGIMMPLGEARAPR